MMETFIASKIMAAADAGGVSGGQAKYRVYFVNTTLYAKYKAGVDTILQTTTSTQFPAPDGYGVCIVTA